MSQELCKNCGHPLPNAAGPGLYCNNCGEPVNPEPEKKVRTRPRDEPGEKTIRVLVTLKKVSGVDKDEDYLIDYFAASIGKQNGAKNPLRLEFPNDVGDTESIYEVELVED